MDLNRIIGAVEEHGRHLEQRLNRIESKVDDLLKFKWKILGFAACAAFFATLMVEIVKSGG